MSEHYHPALSTFDVNASSTTAIGAVGGFGHEIVGVEPEDQVQFRIAPSGASLRGRWWREGHTLKALVHVQAGGTSPKTVSAEIDLRPIARALKKWQARSAKQGVKIGGWPGSFIKAVTKVGKSKLFAQVNHAVRDVVRSKVTAAAVTGAAVVFPPVGVPAAAAYATANAALSAIDRAKQLRDQARAVLSHGSPAQRQSLQARAAELQEAFARAAKVQNTLREIATRARTGDLAATKTARIFSYVMAHRNRVARYVPHSARLPAMPGAIVNQYGNIVSPQWLLSNASEQAPALLATAAKQAQRLIVPSNGRLPHRVLR